MAQNTGTQPASVRPSSAPVQPAAAPAVLRQGRAADAPSAAGQPAPGDTAIATNATQSPPEHSTDGDDARTGPHQQAATRQRDLRLMMRQCDRVLLADHALLAMESWPDNARLSAARRRRDLWLLVIALAAVLLIGGVVGVFPAWVGGSGFGAFVTTLLLAFVPVRRVFSPLASYRELIVQRRQLLNDARRHVAHLEGQDGLAWQCARMASFNPALASFSFSQLLEASQNHTLVRQLTARKYVRLYLFYLVEADKAYQRLQQAFLDGHQRMRDDGLVADSASLTS